MSAARMLTQPTVRARRQKARTARRRRLVTEREKLAALMEAAIARMDEIDGDVDLEPDVDGEDDGDGHPNDLCGRSHLGPGDAADAEENGDREDDLERDRDYNFAVTETTLGEAMWRPGPMPEVHPAPLPMLVLPDQPEGYVAIRVLR